MEDYRFKEMVLRSLRSKMIKGIFPFEYSERTPETLRGILRNYELGKKLTFEQAERNVSNGTIEVISGKMDFRGLLYGTGVGVLLTKDGYFITANHCLNDLPIRGIRYHNGMTFPIQKVCARSVSEDIAICKADIPGSSEPINYRFRDTERISNESVSIYCRKFGEVVRRYGLIRQTTIYGEVKIEEGFRLNMDNYMEIMMDAVQGDSGSPIIDERFSLLGLVNAGTHHPGITAAVKWNRAMQLVDFLRRSV